LRILSDYSFRKKVKFMESRINFSEANNAIERPSVGQEAHSKTKIVVAMGTCGIAAGAREVMAAIVKELSEKNFTDVHVSQIGCIGLCEQEPIVQIFRQGQPKVTYGYVTPDKARLIVDQHVINGKIVGEFVVAIE